jgi:phage terminase large subunit-like protein
MTSTGTFGIGALDDEALFFAELEALWGADLDTPQVELDWEALGISDPYELDEFTRELLTSIEPAGIRAWRAHARDTQLPPAGDWMYWLIRAGRGWGKTFTGSNVLAEWACEQVGDYAVIAPTFGDAVKICASGPSGLVKALGSDLDHFNKNEYVIYLKNGSRIVLASADAPDRLRGWNLSGAWADEVGSWRSTEVWYEGLEFALRIGAHPRCVITTTPRRGSKILLDLDKRVTDGSGEVTLTRGSMMENAANLNPAVVAMLRRRYEGTRLGRQELDGEQLDEVEGALVSGYLIESTRVTVEQVPELDRIAVAVDPATTSKEGSDHTGIGAMGIGPAPAGWHPPGGKVVLAGLAHLYILEDLTIKSTPDVWARRALNAADEWEADVLTAEVNQGGDLVETTARLIAAAEKLYMPAYHGVSASKGKKARAEPVAGLWEQHRVHIVGRMPELEDQWTDWVPAETKESPDRLDWSVWGAVELMPELAVKGGTTVRLISGAGAAA